MNDDEYAHDNGFSDAKSMREYSEEFGAIELPLSNDTVVLSRKKYEHLLWLTTPQPIETAPHIESILVYFQDADDKDFTFWLEVSISKNGDYQNCYGNKITEKAVCWLPRPNTQTTAKPKLDDADDELGR